MRLDTSIKTAALMLLVALGAAAAIAAPVTVPVTGPQVVGIPQLWAQPWTTPPYILQNPCGPGEAAIVFRLLVNNWGTGPSPAENDYHAIWIQDAANPKWAGGMTLPFIKAGDNAGVNVPLVALYDTDQMQGHHVFNVSFEKYGGNTMQIPVDFPPAFCKPVTKVAGPSVATAPPYHTPSPHAVMPPSIPNPNLKTVYFGADVLGTMVADVWVWTDKSVVDNDYANKDGPNVRNLLYLLVGHTHVVSLWHDQAHTQVSQYTNSVMRGYVHFTVAGLYGRTVTKALLHLNGNPTWGTACFNQYGEADHAWHPGDKLFISGAVLGGSPIVGQDLTLDVTSVVKAWANSPNPLSAFTLQDSTPWAIYPMVAISDSCTTSFSQAVLDVTYY